MKALSICLYFYTVMKYTQLYLTERVSGESWSPVSQGESLYIIFANNVRILCLSYYVKQLIGLMKTTEISVIEIQTFLKCQPLRPLKTGTCFLHVNAFRFA